MSDILLGTVADAEGDEIEVSADGDGTVSLEWEHGSAMILGPVARDKLRELLDRAAMPGQATRAPGQPTMRDVAARAGVALKTVSRVVNSEPGVTPETAGRVRCAIDELGFRRNEAARSLRAGYTKAAAQGRREAKRCEQCDEPAVWAWQPPGVDDPVYLCDEDAEGADLNHLRGLDGLAEVSGRG